MFHAQLFGVKKRFFPSGEAHCVRGIFFSFARGAQSLFLALSGVGQWAIFSSRCWMSGVRGSFAAFPCAEF